MATKPSLLSLLLFLLLLTPPLSSSLLFDTNTNNNYITLLSLSHSLLTRVANARLSRNDFSGAARATQIADKLKEILTLTPRRVFSLGWDYLWNYATWPWPWRWRGGQLPTAEISRAAAKLVAAVSEGSGLRSGAERSEWAVRNYKRVLRLSDSLFQSLLLLLQRDGPLREMVLVVQKEVVEGQLLKDCLEVGSRDLDGVIRIAKDIFFTTTTTEEARYTEL